MKKRIIFRADGNNIIGFGHCYRLLALAEMLKDDFLCLFAINRPDSTIRARILDTCELVELDINYTYAIPDKVSSGESMPFDLRVVVNKDDLVILDGYHFMQAYQEALYKSGCRQVIIDDVAGSYPYAAVIINHAPRLDNTVYNPNARLCLGLEYALLRKPFFTPFRKTTRSGNAYISMGGSDSNGFTVTVCKGLLLTKRFPAIHVLCSDQYRSDQIKALRLLEKAGTVILHFNLDANAIVDVVAECNFAFVSASTVMIEAYARGLNCFAGYSTQNQSLLYAGFINNTLAVGLGDLRKLTPGTIAGIIEKTAVSEIKALTTPLNPISAYRKLFSELAYADA